MNNSIIRTSIKTGAEVECPLYLTKPNKGQNLNKNDMNTPTFNGQPAAYYWTALSASINRQELNNLYPNGYTSFAVKLYRGDKVTLQLLVAVGLL